MTHRGFAQRLLVDGGRGRSFLKEGKQHSLINEDNARSIFSFFFFFATASTCYPLLRRRNTTENEELLDTPEQQPERSALSGAGCC